MRRNHPSPIARGQCDIRVLLNTKVTWNPLALRYEWAFEPTGKVLAWLAGDTAARAMKQGFFDDIVGHVWMNIARNGAKYEALLKEKKEESS